MDISWKCTFTNLLMLFKYQKKSHITECVGINAVKGMEDANLINDYCCRCKAGLFPEINGSSATATTATICVNQNSAIQITQIKALSNCHKRLNGQRDSSFRANCLLHFSLRGSPKYCHQLFSAVAHLENTDRGVQVLLKKTRNQCSDKVTRTTKQ